MPVYELNCQACAATEDCYLPHWDSPDPPCPRCGAARQRLMSRFAFPFSGSIHKYTDPNREGSHMDGYWAYRKQSSTTGQPEPVYLDSMQAVKDFNKAEGLAAPGEVPTNCTISADGRRIESRGMPGNWSGGSLPSIPSRLQEIIDLPAENIKPAPATVRPSMPEDFGVRPEVVPIPPEAGA